MKREEIPSSDVEWTVRGGSANGTIDADGLYTAPAIAPLLDHAVSARRKSVSGQSKTANFYVLLRLTVSPESRTAPYEGQVQFTAQVEGVPTNAVPGVVWDMENNPGAVGTITPSGLYTAPAGRSPDN